MALGSRYNQYSEYHFIMCLKAHWGFTRHANRGERYVKWPRWILTRNKRAQQSIWSVHQSHVCWTNGRRAAFQVMCLWGAPSELHSCWLVQRAFFFFKRGHCHIRKHAVDACFSLTSLYQKEAEMPFIQSFLCCVPRLRKKNDKNTKKPITPSHSESKNNPTRIQFPT